jgi:membrane protease YdiL (CAAX protease family)
LGWRILLFLLLTFGGILIFSFMVPSDLPLGTLPILLGSVLAGWAVLRLDGRPPGALGFYFAPVGAKELALGLLLGVGVGGCVTVGMFGLGVLRWTSDAGDGLGYLLMSGRSLWFFTVPAAAEEALMRGDLIQALAEAWGGGWALWVTSFLFGILHLGNPNTSWVGLLNILVAGLFLGVIYLRTASLWWATGAHLGWNWTHGFLADLPVSGLELVDTPLLEPVTRGPDWLSGGSFGPEGSVVSTAVLLVWTVLLWNSSWLKPGDRAKAARPLIMSFRGESR